MTDAPLDPYAELGVARDAPTEEIRKAYRRRAKKAHPDGGGNAEQFDRATRALAVLEDPKKRETFDRTGQVEEERPDNDRALALQVIEKFIEKVINEFVTAEDGKVKDPRRRDLLREFREETRAAILEMKAAIPVGKAQLSFVRDLGRRFAGGDPANPIGRGFKHRADSIAARLADVEKMIETRERALAIAATYTFARDPDRDDDVYFGVDQWGRRR